MKIKAIFPVLAVVSLAFGMSQAPRPATVQSYIVQGGSLDVVMSAVRTVDGEVTHELGIINAVGAEMTQDQMDDLQDRYPTMHVMHDSSVEVAGFVPQADAPSVIDATMLHSAGITGDNVTVAILDSGLWQAEPDLMVPDLRALAVEMQLL